VALLVVISAFIRVDLNLSTLDPKWPRNESQIVNSLLISNLKIGVSLLIFTGNLLQSSLNIDFAYVSDLL